MESILLLHTHDPRELTYTDWQQKDRIVKSNKLNWMVVSILVSIWWSPVDLPLWGILQWSCWASTPATAEASLDDVNGVDVDQKCWVARCNDAGSVGTEWCVGADADNAVVKPYDELDAGARY